MARIVTLSCLGLVLNCGLAGAASPTTPATPAPSISAPAPLAPGMTNAPAVVVKKNAPAPPPDPYNQYGHILAPSDDAAHPMKLNMPFPGIGEMKVPSMDELSIRDKLEKLASLSDADIRAQLDKWPPFAKMKLGDQGQMLARIQSFKDQRTKVAMEQAHDLGLLTLTADQKASFEKQYWDKRLQMEHDLVKQFEPVMQAREQKMREDLFREFSAPGTAGPPPPAKPGTPPAPPAPPAKPNTSPVATNPAPVRP